MKNRSGSNQKGFSIVELVVSTFVFSVVALITTGIFVRALQLERRSFALQAIQENAMSVLGIMTKEIRVGNVLSADSNCLANSLQLDVPDVSGTPVSVEYRLNTSTGIIERQTAGTTFFVSSDEVIFNSLIFCIADSGIDNRTTRVAILASISNRNGKPETIKLQTSLTSRGDLTDELQN